MCKILAHQPNLLPPPGGGQPINAGPSVETWMENRSWETLPLVARVISSSCPGLWGPCPYRPLHLIGHGGRDWGEVHCFVLGRTPGEGKGYPIHHSGLENTMDCIVHGVAKSRTRLSPFHFHFGCFVAWIWPVGTSGEGSGTLWDTVPKLFWAAISPTCLEARWPG